MEELGEAMKQAGQEMSVEDLKDMITAVDRNSKWKRLAIVRQLVADINQTHTWKYCSSCVRKWNTVRGSFPGSVIFPLFSYRSGRWELLGHNVGTRLTLLLRKLNKRLEVILKFRLGSDIFLSATQYVCEPFDESAFCSTCTFTSKKVTLGSRMNK